MTNQLDVLLRAAMEISLPAENIGQWYDDLQQWEKHVGLYKAAHVSLSEVCQASVELGERIDHDELSDEDKTYIASAITMQIPLRRIIGKLTRRIVALENGINTGRHN